MKSNKKALVQQVAGIILHEILHQMGHSHPKDNFNGDYQKDYQQGHVVVIAGDCLASEDRWARSSSPNGQYSDGIGDSSGRIDMSQWKLD